MERDSDPDRSVELRSSLHRDGRELQRALRELGRVARAKLDWRQHLVDRHSAVLLAGFVVGFWWGARSRCERTLVMITAAPSHCWRSGGGR